MAQKLDELKNKIAEAKLGGAQWGYASQREWRFSLDTCLTESLTSIPTRPTPACMEELARADTLRATTGGRNSIEQAKINSLR